MYNMTLRVLFEKASLYRTKFEDESLKISDNNQDEHLVSVTVVSTAKPGFIQYRENIPNLQEQLAECRLVSLGKF